MSRMLIIIPVPKIYISTWYSILVYTHRSGVLHALPCQYQSSMCSLRGLVVIKVCAMNTARTQEIIACVMFILIELLCNSAFQPDYSGSTGSFWDVGR